MLDSISRFKWLPCLGILLLIACSISRDNVLDPKNEESYRAQKILIEAFVNTENDFEYNQYMLAALDSLTLIYSDRLAVAEYHRNTLNDSSLYHQNVSEILYSQYVDATGGFKGVPHIFINGIAENVQGASSVKSALLRLQEVLDPHFADNSEYTLELSYSISGNRLTPDVKLARLGNLSASNLIVKTILVCPIQAPYHTRVVVASSKSSVIPEIEAGTWKRIEVPSMNYRAFSGYQLIAYVTDSTENRVLQCNSVDVE